MARRFWSTKSVWISGVHGRKCLGALLWIYTGIYYGCTKREVSDKASVMSDNFYNVNLTWLDLRLVPVRALRLNKKLDPRLNPRLDPRINKIDLTQDLADKRPDPRPDVRPLPRPDPKTDLRPNPKTDARPDSRPDQTPCWSVLEFWKIKLEKSSSTNWIFSLQKTIWKLIFPGYTLHRQ